MTTYKAEVENKKKYKGNVVILLKGVYFGMRQPDSGLVIDSDKKGLVTSLTVNPTTVNLKKVNQTIASYSFRLLDKIKNKVYAISSLFADDSNLLIDEEVRIFLGRTGVGMDFADYFELPRVTVDAVDHADSTYNFVCKDSTDRMNVEVFNGKGTLQADIQNNTTSFLMSSTEGFEDSGYIILNREICSYTNKTATELQNITRGEFSTVPVEHDFGSTVYMVERIVGNPIDIFLKIVTSGGGGGAYDVLFDGLGIDQSLIDISAIETLRDDHFDSEVYEFFMYGIESGLSFIEKEIFLSCNLRLITNENQKLSLALLDQAGFDEASNNPIDENSITTYPKWSVNKKDMVSKVVINYDYDEGKRTYKYTKEFINENAANFKSLKPLTLNFKGIRESQDGANIVNQRGQRLVQRFGTPNPEISLKTHIDKSLYNVGQKVLLSSSKIPNASGSLQFADSLEVVSRALNHISGDVTFKLQYTSYAGIRQAYIAPTTSIMSVTSQKVFNFPAGRGSEYEIGWKLRLYNKSTGQFTSDPVNEIKNINGDTIEMVNDFSTTLDDSIHALRFADYDQVADSQKKFAFIGIAGGGNFADGSSSYKITL